MIHDSIRRHRRYSVAEAWERAFAFLATLDPNTPECHFISLRGDDVFARVMRYETKDPAQAVIEAHDSYVDIQVSLQHAEGIEWFPREELEAASDYDSEKDVVFFQAPRVVPVRVDNYPGYFTALWPEDAHRPQLSTGAPGWVKKVVVKVRAALLES